MKVVLVNSSPNTDGVCNYAMQLMMEELQAAGVETDYYQIGSQAIRGCMGCGGCEKIGKCVYNDLVNVVHEAMKSADGFVIASPVHYASASGAATAFMDRLFYSGSKDLRYKPGCCVVSCRRGGASASFDQLNKYFTINQMPVISSCYWNSIHGNTKEEAMQDLEGIRIVRTLARNLAYQLRLMEAGKKAGVTLPEPLEPVHTNFIR